MSRTSNQLVLSFLVLASAAACMPIPVYHEDLRIDEIEAIGGTVKASMVPDLQLDERDGRTRRLWGSPYILKVEFTEWEHQPRSFAVLAAEIVNDQTR